MNNQIWDDYNSHIRNCPQCKSEYDLQEEGDINNCCEKGLEIIKGLHKDFWEVLTNAVSREHSDP